MLRTIGSIWFIFAYALFGVSPIELSATEPANSVRVYIGTYTGKGSDGIYVADFDPATGSLSIPRLAARAQNPSFLAVHPSGKYLYAANEIDRFQGKATGGISAFSIDAKDGSLTILNQLASGGGAPCHISLDPSAKVLLSANYNGGNVAAFTLAPDGKLKARSAFIQHEGKSINPDRQEKPHAHAINCDPSGKFVFANDLGVDKVFIYRLDTASGSLTPSDPPALTIKAGSGPRHLAIDGKIIYVLNELASTVTVFAFDFESGKATELQTISTLPEGASGDSWCAEIVSPPSLPFIYASNRGHDSLAIFERDGINGKLTLKGHVKTGFKTPRNFAFDPSGRFCLVGSQSTNEVYVHQVDKKTGQMTLIGNPVQVGSPVCFRFAPVATP